MIKTYQSIYDNAASAVKMTKIRLLYLVSIFFYSHDNTKINVAY